MVTTSNIQAATHTDSQTDRTNRESERRGAMYSNSRMKKIFYRGTVTVAAIGMLLICIAPHSAVAGWDTTTRTAAFNWFNTWNSACDSWGCQMRNEHNKYRQEVGVPNLAWSNWNRHSAQDWADHLAATSSWGHSGRNGENIWFGGGSDFSADRVLDSWAKNEKPYFNPSGTFSSDVNQAGACQGDRNGDGKTNYYDCGHYTQVVWKNTNRVGCAHSYGYLSGYGYGNFVVCHYSPVGNIDGQKVY